MTDTETNIVRHARLPRIRVIFVIRPDPMRKYFVLWGWGGGGGAGLDVLRNSELKMENHVNFWLNILCF